jgi:hypothetical protein
MKSVAHAVHAVMVPVAAHLETAPARVLALVLVVRLVPIPLQRMAVTNPLKQQVLMHRKLPLSASARLSRLGLQVALVPRPQTVKENKHATTRSPQIPQRAKGP